MFCDDFCLYLSKLQCIIESCNTLYVFILGDFNDHIQSTSIFGGELIAFCNNNEFCFVDKERLSGYCLTHLLILVKLMTQHHAWITALVQYQVNLLYLMYQSLIRLYVLTISICIEVTCYSHVIISYCITVLRPQL